MLFAGMFEDERLANHDIKFRAVLNKHREELREMAGYYSDVEKIVAESITEGEAKGIIEIALELNGTKDFIIRRLVEKLSITTQTAERYYEM